MRKRQNKDDTASARGKRRSVLLLIALLFASVQCQLLSSSGQAPQPTEDALARATIETSATATMVTSSTPTPDPTKTPPATPTALPSPTASPLPTPTSTTTPLPHPLYCLEPPDDYTRVTVGQHALTARTLSMLQVAQQIYTGPGDIMRITQGSYRDVVEASFGTHAGGGAVDISIRDPRNESVFLWDEAEAMVLALRYAGFAAWFRDTGDLGPNSPAHIHAIAVGDVELSAAAQEQVTGVGGYLAGMDGLIAPYGPNPDRHGGPVICSWMVE